MELEIQLQEIDIHLHENTAQWKEWEIHSPWFAAISTESTAHTTEWKILFYRSKAHYIEVIIQIKANEKDLME